MPTGYTTDIANGISFKKYATQCARAFGVVIHMRDNKITDKITYPKKDSYYADEHKTALVYLDTLKNFTTAQCAKAAKDEYQRDCKQYKKYISCKNKLRKQYEKMLVKAKAFKVPSADFEEYHRFIVSQIESSIEFDCCTAYSLSSLKALKLLSGEEWRTYAIEKQLKDAAYYKDEMSSTSSKHKERVKWIKDLKTALNGIK